MKCTRGYATLWSSQSWAETVRMQLLGVQGLTILFPFYLCVCALAELDKWEATFTALGNTDANFGDRKTPFKYVYIKAAILMTHKF